MMRVRYAPLAFRDLEGIYNYIEVDSPANAARVIARIRAAIAMLARFPRLGRQSELVGVRKLGVARLPHIVIYEIDDDQGEVIVLRVYHGARNMPY